MITIKSASQIEKMRAAGALLHDVLQTLRAAVQPGVTTLELDRLAEKRIREAGAIPSFKGFEGFPFSICASVDDQVVHGFATKDRLREGQILSIDCGVILNGWQSDSALTVPVGHISPEAEKLIRDTEKCFWLGADQAAPATAWATSPTRCRHTPRRRATASSAICAGHGIGEEMHEDPSIPTSAAPGAGVRLQPGMTLAIEPMICMGDWHVYLYDNDWTVATRDQSLCSHYEHTVLVTDGEPEVLSCPGANVREMAR